MSQPSRLSRGGLIDRDAPLQFTFDGRPIDACRGDTVASALLANGVTLVGRSFKYHRPRGIVAAGSEDPNAFVQLGQGARTLPNRLATVTPATPGLKVRSVNAWPSLEYDLMSALGLVAPFIPAGFYYKTLMWPRRFWPLYEHVLRHAAGLGHAPTAPDPDRYDHVHAHCDVLVVGAGPAGLAAARAAAQSGARVILADEQAELGGGLLADPERVDGVPAPDWAATTAAELSAAQGVTVLPNTTAFGLYEGNLVLLFERLFPSAPDQCGSEQGARVWRVLPKQIVLASGAHERPLLFANNDRPGVMLAGAISTYVRRYAVAPGSRAVFFTNNDSAYRAALDLADAGVPVAAIADVRRDPDGDLSVQARAQGIPVHAGAVVRQVHGRRCVAAAELCSLDGSPLGSVECDLLGVLRRLCARAPPPRPGRRSDGLGSRARCIRTPTFQRHPPGRCRSRSAGTGRRTAPGHDSGRCRRLGGRLFQRCRPADSSGRRNAGFRSSGLLGAARPARPDQAPVRRSA